MGGGGPRAQPRTASSAAVLGFITTWEVMMGSGKRSKTRCRRLKSSIAAAAISTPGPIALMPSVRCAIQEDEEEVVEDSVMSLLKMPVEN